MTSNGFINYFANWKHSKKVYRVVLVITIYLASLDIYTDWGFYIDVVSMRPGLVYGYIANDLVIPLFVFTVLGSVLYLFEMIFIFCQLFGLKIELIKFDSLMIIIMWFDVIPHFVINSLIASCHEFSVSYFQLLRTAISLGAMLIRFIVTSIEYCVDRYESKEKEQISETCCAPYMPFKRLVIYRIITIIGFMIQIVLASLLFQFTYIQRYTGHFQFHLPKDLIVSHVDPERYFNTVNIYLSLGMMNKKYKSQYMNLASLYHVMYSQRYGMMCNVRLSLYKGINTTDDVGFHLHKKFLNLNGQDIINNECWSLFIKDDLIRNINCSLLSKNYVLTESYIFHIKYIPPDEYRQFGLIRYQSLRAIYPEKYKPIKIRLKYFASDNGGLLSNVLEKSFNSTSKFYTMDNLYSVKKIWKTGYAMCETNAAQHPIYVKSKFKL